jgi:hypothetical protein
MNKHRAKNKQKFSSIFNVFNSENKKDKLLMKKTPWISLKKIILKKARQNSLYYLTPELLE